MKDTDPLPSKVKAKNVEIYKLIIKSLDDLIYESFVKPYINVFGKYKIKKIK